MDTKLENIILFDGVCNFCNDSINFVIKNDDKKKFKFCPLQSPTGEKLIGQYQLQGIDSIILIKNQKAYIKSAAVLQIAKTLGGFYALGYVFIIVPAFIRNSVYDYIAKNRYKWFGKKDACMMPTPEIRQRFIE